MFVYGDFWTTVILIKSPMTITNTIFLHWCNISKIQKLFFIICSTPRPTPTGTWPTCSRSVSCWPGWWRSGGCPCTSSKRTRCNVGKFLNAHSASSWAARRRRPDCCCCCCCCCCCRISCPGGWTRSQAETFPGTRCATGGRRSRCWGWRPGQAGSSRGSDLGQMTNVSLIYNAMD